MHSPSRPLATALVFGLALISPLRADGPYMANGIKIGEVTANSALVWTRLTSVPEMVTTGEEPKRNDESDKPTRPPEFGSVPGTQREVRSWCLPSLVSICRS